MDFAIHPSNKLMLSVSKGEKCMRLWNLVTGKKAGVLTFSREMLQAAGEGRFSTGEGRRVVWDTEGEEFAVAFERGVLVFGVDCQVKAHIIPTPRTKIHQMYYLPGGTPGALTNILAIATEDGRIMFYNTNFIDETKAAKPAPTSNGKPAKEPESKPCTLIAQLGGPATGITGRVKDFQIMPTLVGYVIISGGSDGSIRLWNLRADELQTQQSAEADKPGSGFTAKQVGTIIGTHSIGSRITCLKAFVMTGKVEEAAEDDEEEWAGAKTESEEESSDEE
jgi:protein MAK11